MATSSILKNLNITKKPLARGYVRALERAVTKKPSSKQAASSDSRTVKTLRRDEVKAFFDAN